MQEEVFLDGLVIAVRGVVPDGAGDHIARDTSLEACGVDSLGILEALLLLEETVGVILPESVIRAVVLSGDVDLSSSLETLGRQLFEAAQLKQYVPNTPG